MDEIVNRFSVIIPLYNKIDYITRAINSVLMQEYQNFEIVIVNDGSTDGSETIMELFDDKRIHLITQLNQGVSAARNTGARNAKNEFLAFLDADDIWNPNFLKEVNDLIIKFPKAGIYATNNFFEYPNGKVVVEKLEWLFNGVNTGLINDYFALFSKIKKSPFSNSNFCIPSKIYNEFNGYKEGVKLTEDSDLWCRIALKYEIAYSILPLSTYYIALLGSTHLKFEPNEFQVSLTLKKALKDKEVRLDHVRSVQSLISLQLLNLIKLAILTNNKLFALKKIFNIQLFRFYFFDAVQCVISIFIPKLFLSIYQKKKHF